MSLPKSRHDRELAKFTLVEGETAVRTTATGTFKFSGLGNAGKITEVTIDSTSWTSLPATPLVDRNALSIQNRSGTEIKINYDNNVTGYEGIAIINGGERYYDLTETIIIYAKAASGTATITVEELS